MTMTAFKIDFIEAEHPLTPPKTQEQKAPRLLCPSSRIGRCAPCAR